MRLGKGIAKKLGEMVGINRFTISAYANAIKRPSPSRALTLERACSEMGMSVPFKLWLVGSRDEIKTAMMADRSDDRIQPASDEKPG